jgi:putative ABC transport system permease protein
MLKNHLKIAWRNLWRNKLYSAINIVGLAIGLTICMLIVLYVGHESTYDRFHKNAENIGWVQAKMKVGTDSVFVPLISYQATEAVKRDLSSVHSFMRIRNGEKNTIVANPGAPSRKFVEEHFIFADSNFFSFFSFPLLKGNAESALKQPFSVVLSEKSARKYFGSEDPIGKTLTYNNEYGLLVTGVAKDVPSNSSIRYDMVASLGSMLAISSFKEDIADERSMFCTYFLSESPAQFQQIEQTLGKFESLKESGPVTTRYIVTPLKDIHLKANYGDASNTKYLNVFPFVAALILLLALINYMSLSTARATLRSKEVGVRKVFGAARKTIASQFFIESALYTSIAFLLAFVLCSAIQPRFFSFLEITIDNSFLYHPLVLYAFLVLFAVSVFISATYPAILLSAFKPVMVLYGKLSRQTGGMQVRKFFTVFQFGISVVLIVCAIVINRQLFFIRHTNTGVDRENIVMVPFGEFTGKQLGSFKQEISAIPGIKQIAISDMEIYKGYNMMGVRFPGSDKMIMLPVLDVDQQFISMLGLKWKIPPADSLYYMKDKIAVINESAIAKLQLAPDPLSQKIDEQFTVAGVLKDFNYASLQHRIEPLALMVAKDDSNAIWRKRGGNLLVKTDGSVNTPALLSRLKTVHEKYDRDQPFRFSFLDQNYERLYRSEERLSRILSVFTGFTIFIACLGLFGLATFIALQKTREIGIRKVLGASVQQITLMLSKEFVMLVVIAIVFAVPFAWYLTNEWLQGFVYRINVNWGFFAIAGALTLLIAILTISFHSIRSALANPVKSIRGE